MTILVSVIIPVYNVVTYLRECVESVRTQSYSHLEILLIDDGSTDGSDVLCDELAAQDNRIVVHHKANAGLSEARNDGIKKATGEYLYFIDSDDVLIDDTTIEKMVHGATAFNTPLVVAAYHRIENGLPNHCVKLAAIPEARLFTSSEMIEKLYQYDTFSSNFIVVHNKLYKRELFDDCMFPPRKLHEDEFVIHHLYLRAGQVLWLPYETYGYRIRENSIMRSAYSLGRLAIIDAYEERIQTLERYQLPIFETVYYLMNHLSYHSWCLYKYGFHKEQQLLKEKIVYYYNRYSSYYGTSRRLKLAAIRYINTLFRYSKHSIYERAYRLVDRLRGLLIKKS